MEYRKLPHGEENISVLGLGSSSIGGAGEKEIAQAAEMAVENGINYFDLTILIWLPEMTSLSRYMGRFFPA